MILRTLVLMVVALAAAVVPVGAASAAGANEAAAQLCRADGWQTVGTTTNEVFRNRGECVRYGARGGTFVPLLQAIVDERCIPDPIVPPNSACFTVTGFGLEPGSEVVVTLMVDGEPLVFRRTVDAQGNIFFQTAAGCVPGTEEVVLSVFASGVTATGAPLTTPQDTTSIFCTRG